MRIIIRRPHAYTFKGKYNQAPIPGIAVLDENGKMIGGVRLPSANAVEKLLKLLKPDEKPSGNGKPDTSTETDGTEANGVATQNVVLAVSGMT